jgi:hypothetical protein
MATCHASRCITIAGANQFYGEIIKNIFEEKMTTLGEAVFAAKRKVISDNPSNDNYYGPAVLQTILGDPALRIFNKTAVGIDKTISQRNNNTILIHPNPFKNRISIKINKQNCPQILVEIYKPDGKLINSVTFRNKYEFTIGSTLHPGIYFFKVIIKEHGSIRENRFIKVVKL